MKHLWHIHIGKCAGGSVNRTLEKMGLKYNQIHCGAANDELIKLLKNDNNENIYLVTVRDPIDRFISAFNFDKYEKVIVNKTKSPTWNGIYEHFKSVNHLVGSYFSDDEVLRDWSRIALNRSHLHMQMGVSWYISPDTAEKLPINRTAVIRTENLEEDFRRFCKSFFPELTPLPLIKEKSSADFLEKINIDKPKYLSKENRDLLKYLLFEDYVTLNILYKRGLISHQYFQT